MSKEHPIKQYKNIIYLNMAVYGGLPLLFVIYLLVFGR